MAARLAAGTVCAALLAPGGRLVVTEQAGKAAEVVIDNVVVGRAPWDGSVALGDHVVLLRGDGELGDRIVSEAPGGEREHLVGRLSRGAGVEPGTAL